VPSGRAGDTGDGAPDTPSTALARAGLGGAGTVLDVGCGGGRAGLALVPPAVAVTGVDRDAARLAAFRTAASARGVSFVALLGEWPAVAGEVPAADVVVCHDVAYSVPDLGPFAVALHTHARRRVVLELRRRHPLAATAPLWRQFWGLERPAGPTADDALAVLREAGLPARQVPWQDPARPTAVPFGRQVEIARIRLCLPADRDGEIAAALRAQPARPPEVVTIWWDRSGDLPDRA